MVYFDFHASFRRYSDYFWISNCISELHLLIIIVWKDINFMSNYNENISHSSDTIPYSTVCNYKRSEKKAIVITNNDNE